LARKREGKKRKNFGKGKKGGREMEKKQRKKEIEGGRWPVVVEVHLFASSAITSHRGEERKGQGRGPPSREKRRTCGTGGPSAKSIFLPS